MHEEILKCEKYSGSKWGNGGHLEVVGYYLKQNTYDKYFHKIYVLHCSECSKDLELFPIGSIKCTLGTLRRGGIPCACTPRYNWTEEQYKILLKRKSASLGVTFIGWSGRYLKSKTRLLMSCDKHGEYTTHSVFDFIAREDGCPSCKFERMKENCRKSDEECIEEFLATGAFNPNTRFWRSPRLDKNGWSFMWYVDCPDCGQIGEAWRANLARGHKPCACRLALQKQAYINLVIEPKGSSPVAVKFGISTRYEDRLIKQKRSSIYDIENYGVWEFNTTLEATQAERDCKLLLKRKVLSKSELGDGHTETTYVQNINEIIDIYERNGGIRIK